MIKYDDLSIYFGDDIEINKKIVVTQPTIKQIKEFGEREYFSVVQTLTASPSDLKWQLWSMGQDFTKVKDYDVFITLLSQMLSSQKKNIQAMLENKEQYKEELEKFTEKELKQMCESPLKLVLKDIDFADFILANLNGDIVLYNPVNEITIDRIVYQKIVTAVRQIHGFTRNGETPGNEATKRDMIEDAKEEYEISKDKPFKSILLPIISTLDVQQGTVGTNILENAKIGTLFMAAKRANRILDAKSLLNGAYCGFSDLSKIDKNRFNIFGEI